MKKRQYKKQRKSKRIKKNTQIKNKIYDMMLDAEKAAKVSYAKNEPTHAYYWRGLAAGLYDAWCLIRHGRW